MKTVFTVMIFSLVFMQTAHAETQDGKSRAIYAHEHYTFLRIDGDSAKMIYNNLKTPIIEDFNMRGEKMGSFTKKSTDGRMYCRYFPTDSELILKAFWDTAECIVNFDSSTGELKATWKK